MVELSAFWQNYFTPTNGAVFVVEICFAHCYRHWAIVELRRCAFERRQGDVKIADDLLSRGTGKLALARTVGDGARVVVGDGARVSAATIADWKRSGVSGYDELFCAGSTLCVRQDLREEEELEGRFRYWVQQLEQLVGGPRSGGPRSDRVLSHHALQSCGLGAASTSRKSAGSAHQSHGLM